MTKLDITIPTREIRRRRKEKRTLNQRSPYMFARFFNKKIIRRERNEIVIDLDFANRCLIVIDLRTKKQYKVTFSFLLHSLFGIDIQDYDYIE